MNDKKIEIEFWESQDGFNPVKEFFEKIPKNDVSKIQNRLKFASEFSFSDLLNYGDILTFIVGYSKIKPRPYEFKIKISPPIRVLCYRKENALIFVEAIQDSFSNKRLLKKAIEVYKKRVC